MSAWSTWSAGTRALIIGIGGFGAVGLGYLGWQLSRPVAAPIESVGVAEPEVTAPTPEPTASVETPATAPEAEPVVPEVVAAVEEPVAKPEVPPAEPPRFDNWRVEPDGAAVVSGRAAPGSRVEVLVDGALVSETAASAAGEFAALFTLPPNDKPSLMTLTMTPPGGEAVLSEEMVALGVIKGPEVVASAPEASPLPEEPAVASAPIPDAAPPDAILLTEEGAVVLQGDPPLDPALAVAVAVDTISYAPDGAVQLGGRGTAGEMVQIYLDNALQKTVQIAEDGQWRVTLTDTQPGIYTLRVDQQNKAGKVTSRFETPFKRETLEALAAVVEAPAVPVDAPTVAAVDAVAEPVTETAAEPVADAVAEQVAEPVVTAEALVPTPEVATAAAEPETEAVTSPEPVVEPAPVAVAAAEPAKAQPVTITVQPGFTLWGIAQQSYGDGVMYVQVFEANKDKIKDPDLIYPGQVFAMPTDDGG
jgi:LysM repeat protein